MRAGTVLGAEHTEVSEGGLGERQAEREDLCSIVVQRGRCTVSGALVRSPSPAGRWGRWSGEAALNG